MAKYTTLEVYKFLREYQTIKTPNVRFGQWFLNAKFPDVAAPEIYYCQNDLIAAKKITEDRRFCSDVL